jgi:hypothetical protein
LRAQLRDQSRRRARRIEQSHDGVHRPPVVTRPWWSSPLMSPLISRPSMRVRDAVVSLRVVEGIEFNPTSSTGTGPRATRPRICPPATRAVEQRQP